MYIYIYMYEHDVPPKPYSSDQGPYPAVVNFLGFRMNTPQLVGQLNTGQSAVMQSAADAGSWANMTPQSLWVPNVPNQVPGDERARPKPL